MVNLIDYTYFKNKLFIPNTNVAEVQTFISNMNAEHQYEFLNQIMGPALYTQFVSWYESDPLDQTNNFYYLLNGKIFVVDGKSYNWRGLVNTLKVSPLANYVYYQIQENNITQTAMSGEVKTKSQNSAPAGAMAKMVDAWNEMVNMLRVYGVFMDTFYGTTGTLENNYRLLPYKAPIQIKVDTTAGLISNTTSFTFDGSGGKYDWRGYEVYPERIGQGTLVRDVDYSWDVETAEFNLLISGQTFSPAEYFNITFGRGGVVFTDITSDAAWTSYRLEANELDVFNHKNTLGL